MMQELQTVFRSVGFGGQQEAKFVDLPTFKGGDQDPEIGWKDTTMPVMLMEFRIGDALH